MGVPLRKTGKQRTYETTVSIKEETKLGPIIICVDTSGSMHGTPENIAKAIAFTMAVRAKEQKRACRLISFSTDICVCNLSDQMTASSLVDFLKLSFHGGTDAAPALKHAVKTMEENAYNLADVLMISDFIMQNHNPELVEAIQKQRGKGNKFYSLCIGNAGNSKVTTVFDKEWAFDPSSMSIVPLAEGLIDICDS